jgi:23S rRNA (pseudouridine1915-N3)-methyltransferase
VNYRILAIGKPKLAYAAEGVREYTNRLGRYTQLEIEFLKDQNESRALLDRSEGTYRIALDERGEQPDTADLVTRINRMELRGDLKAVTFLIGGADGHDPEFRQQCDEVWSLSALTLQHELALVVLLEQLYRAFTIKRGEPYHRI